ncbi:MAG: acyl-CoA dehydrogenase family protein [Pseudomonadales bacterium]
MSDLETFRTETRAWLEENCPPKMREPFKSENEWCWGGRKWEFQSEDQRLWLERMGEKGWTTPTWPSEYGGGGLNKEEAKVLQQEMRALGCRKPLDSFGISMLGPALMKFGNEEQKLEHLPKIIRGEIRWCQGYSEPNAGSDLASLATKAEDIGDHYLVNGSKIWTSYADKCDWIFCLVRTDTTVKHDGISFLLFDMDSEGVTTSPIQLISGSSPFCETYFDNVKVPKDNLMGDLNKGWTIAKYLLTHEREMISSIGESFAAVSPSAAALETIGSDTDGKLANSSLRRDCAQMEIDGLAFFLSLERGKDEAKGGAGMGAVSSMFKYYGTELNKRRMELQLAIDGANASVWQDNPTVPALWLRSKANSIEGGTSEVQLNIISKRVLGLPDK